MIKLGTNFLYKGILFLDDRQGIAGSKSDLKNWDFYEVPLPAGFEVYLNISEEPAWYTYKPAPTGTFDNETGWFEKRLDKSYVDILIDNVWNGSRGIEEIWEYLNNLNINPDIPSQITLSASIDPGQGHKLPGSASFTPKITWSLKNFSTPIAYSSISSARVIVNGVSQSMSPIQSPWIAPSSIGTTTGTYSYKIEVDYNGTTYSSSTFTYYISPYTWYKWFGVSNKTSLDSLSDLSSSSLVERHGWSGLTIDDTNTFNCSGGVYPYYIFPKSLWDSHSGTFKMIVGGFNVTTYTVGDLTIGSTQYKTVRHSIIQHGNSIQIKYEQ